MKNQLSIFLILILFCGIALTPVKVFSQNAKIENFASQGDFIPLIQDRDLKFTDVQNAFYNYWAGRTDYKGNGWKVFKRWEYINESRVLPDGKLQAPGYVFSEYEKYIEKVGKSATGNWTNQGPTSYVGNNTGQPTGMGRINAVAFHPTDANTIFVGSPSGGFWKTTDGGTTWSNLSNNLPTIGVSSILIHPDTPNTIYIGTGDRDASDALPMGVFKSTDGGSTWTQMNSTMGDVTVGVMLMHPTDPDIILAATSGGIFKTTNGGATWSLRSSGNFKDIKFKPGDPTIVYATRILTPSEFYRSSDTGDSWTKITSGIPTSGIGSRMVIGVSADNANYVYLVQIKSSDRTFAGLLRSTDSGLSFSIQSTTPNIFDYACDGSGTSSQATYDLCITVDPSNANTIYVGSINNWKSTDGGLTWDISSHWVGTDYSAGSCAASVHADQHWYEWSPLNGNLYVGNDGGIYYTADGGSTWPEITNNLAITQIYKIGQSATNSNYTIFGCQDNGTSITTSGSLFTTTIGGDGEECIIDYSNTNYCYGTTGGGVIKRSTTGLAGSYSNVASVGNNGIGSGESATYAAPYMLHETNPGVMFAGFRNVYRCNDIKASLASAVTFTAISSGETSTCRVLEQSPADVNIMYVVRSGSLKRTDNANDAAGSVTWTACALPGGSTPTELESHSTNANVVYATAGYRVYKSGDKGATWTEISSNLPGLFINTIVMDKNSNEGLYIGNQTGVWYKDADMTEWVLFSDGLPPVDIRELEIYYDAVSPYNNRIKAGTYGRGLWESDLIETGVLNPTNLAADATSDTQIDVTWTLNPSGNNVMLAYNTSATFGTPVNGTTYTTTIPGGGTVLYNGSNTIFNHISLTPDTQYFYKLWSYDGSTTYSTGATTDEIPVTSAANFTVNNSIGCTGSLTVNFTDASAGAYNSWAWDVDNNGTIDYTVQNPSHTYSSPGAYSIKLTISNGAASVTKEKMILVMSSQPTVITGCALTAHTNTNYGMGISKFNLNSIDNATPLADVYYNNYTCTRWTSLELNKTYSVTVTTGTVYNEGVKVYIDYNDNGIFEESTEVAISFPAAKGSRTLTFTSPLSGIILNKGIRLRVLSKYGSIPANSCDNGTYGFAEDYTVYFVGDATWNGNSNTDWFTAANWSYNAVPGAGINAIIPSGLTNYPQLTANGSCNNLTIESGATLTINPGQALTVNGLLTNNEGISGLLIKSDATGTGSLIHSTANVPATVERYIAAADWDAWDDGWHLLSSPVANHPINGAFTIVPADEYDFYAWSEPNNIWVNFKETGSPNFLDVNGSNTFNLQKGYLTAYKTTDTKVFEGNLNVADVAVSGLTLSSGTNQGWNLLGNPFASALTWNTGWTTSNIGGVANIWNEAGRSYTPRSAGDPIPQANGFMVQVTSGTGSLTIPASAREHSSQAWYKNNSYPVIRLFAHNLDNPSFQESQVRFNPAATNSFDLEYDGNFLAGYAPEFYSLLNNKPLMVNSLPFTSEVSIPFSFIKNEGTNFKIEAAINDLSQADVFLLDRQTGIDHNLSQSPDYKFTSIAGDSPERFMLHFKSLGINEAGLTSQVSAKWLDGVIQINNPQNEVITSVSISDVTGQEIYNSVKNTRDSLTIGLSVPSGLYLIFIETNSHFVVKKLFIP